jgi:hypothetical protein
MTPAKLRTGNCEEELRQILRRGRAAEMVRRNSCALKYFRFTIVVSRSRVGLALLRYWAYRAATASRLGRLYSGARNDFVNATECSRIDIQCQSTKINEGKEAIHLKKVRFGN